MIDFLDNYPIIDICADITMFLIAAALVINLIIVCTNRSGINRIISLDTFANLIMAIMVIYGLKHGTHAYTNGIIIISILSFTSTVLWAKYISHGNIVYPLTSTAAVKLPLDLLNESKEATTFAEEIEREHKELGFSDIFDDEEDDEDEL